MLFTLICVMPRSACDGYAQVLSLPVATDVIIIVINCIIVIALGLLNKGHLPARAAVVLYALYGGYLVINLIVHYL